MDKNRVVNIKTFEQFKDDNAQYYPILIAHLKEILNRISSKTQAGDWSIEGTVDVYGIVQDSTDNEITFSNPKMGDDIFIEYSSNTTHKNDPGTNVTAPYDESNMKISIDEVILHKNNGMEEYNIIPTDELMKLMNEILEKIYNIK